MIRPRAARTAAAMILASLSATSAFAPTRIGGLVRPASLRMGRPGTRPLSARINMNLSPDARNRGQKRRVSAARSLSVSRDSLKSSASQAPETSMSYFEETWNGVLDREETKSERESEQQSCRRAENFCELDPFFFEEHNELPLSTNHPSAAKPAMRPSEDGALSDMLPQHWIDFAHRLADASGEVLLRHYRSPRMRNANKADGSPVTVADREAEQVMRDLIEAEMPHTGIFGEETGVSASGAKSVSGATYTWVLDPIDGTKSFLVGKPTFGTLISLVRDGVHSRAVGGGQGVRDDANGDVVRADGDTRELGDAVLFCTDTDMLKGPGELEAFNRLKARTRFCMYSCDCYGYGLLASGHGSLVVEADLKPYDFC
eukprot:CAMPEP_0206216476 /NCGR_PEP_ID=MMETSP0047_2-20121206/2740_1 /ASSEMBLY_ACC=CAM_ASM_000192 /TAXON_ID=195065 /ORGANISM="Chroomonas mesostigmatica_cf, Strain CCMP1168" /LENGTH=373 /DNA_ID=CAMNT_0053638823 /DNA_START=161 /DNA_END=1280 /DNA_ORIENTATION=+